MSDLFRQYDAAYSQFTFYDGEPDRQVLQVGLTGMFRLGDGGTPLGRKRIAGIFNYFHKQFGQHLKYGYFTDPNRLLKYGTRTMEEKQKQILSQNGGYLDFRWSSGDDLELVNNYEFSAYSSPEWFEKTHKDVSVVYFYIPLQTLKDNAIDFDEWIRSFCEILQPLSGFFGLALQQCYANYRYQHIEFEVAQKFLGLHIITGGWDKEFRDGIDSVNWYTFFNRNWLNQLGDEAALKHTLNDERIKILPYEDGMIIKAGELPELGWIEEDPYPELYVKVNHALKPIRAPKIESLGYGSIAGEIRFNDRTTAEWLTRFDNATLPSIVS
ncbi:type VI immunity family protein [Thorsellia anophelis]|uniref:DUF3396 domain-containing protein n=1 Tax=Thorsellia anophelis DSM 18579 TaxID=1123402 RepID=A0A1I0FIW8_9GAMM|nr:type VI immunity family protein [Thorsellia anophelis]SET57388.1 Protein of unknown function [Thorsellia anophelis DSM 18579]